MRNRLSGCIKDANREEEFYLDDTKRAENVKICQGRVSVVVLG
jgi:hypothetical protein